MSSRFVSAGGAEVKAPEGLSSTTDDAWAKAREQVERAKQPAKNEPAPGTQEGGKSLFEHLQDQKVSQKSSHRSLMYTCANQKHCSRQAGGF